MQRTADRYVPIFLSLLHLLCFCPPFLFRSPLAFMQPRRLHRSNIVSSGKNQPYHSNPVLPQNLSDLSLYTSLILSSFIYRWNKIDGLEDLFELAKWPSFPPSFCRSPSAWSPVFWTKTLGQQQWATFTNLLIPQSSLEILYIQQWVRLKNKGDSSIGPGNMTFLGPIWLECLRLFETHVHMKKEVFSS